MPNTPSFCDMCGGNLRQGARVCGSCGTPVPGAEPMPTHAAAAGQPQAVVPQHVAANAAGQPVGQRSGYAQAPSQPRYANPQAQAPVNIVINGSPAPASQYANMQGYRCAGCGSFLYDGGPACACRRPWTFADFAALGLGMTAASLLFADDPGALMVAAAVEGGGFGYAMYGGGLYGGGGFVDGLFVGAAVGDMMAYGQEQQQIAYQQGEIDQQQGEIAGLEARDGDGQGYGGQDGYGGGDFSGQGYPEQGYTQDSYGQQGYPDPGGFGGGTFAGQGDDQDYVDPDQ